MQTVSCATAPVSWTDPEQVHPRINNATVESGRRGSSRIPGCYPQINHSSELPGCSNVPALQRTARHTPPPLHASAAPGPARALSAPAAWAAAPHVPRSVAAGALSLGARRPFVLRRVPPSAHLCTLLRSTSVRHAALIEQALSVQLQAHLLLSVQLSRLAVCSARQNNLNAPIWHASALHAALYAISRGRRGAASFSSHSSDVATGAWPPVQGVASAKALWSKSAK